MSRLKREGNPPSGQLASPVPQAWDPSINDFREITGQSLGDGRFGADGLQWGKTAGGLYLPIKVDNEGRQEVTLSGTTVEVHQETFSGTIDGSATFPNNIFDLVNTQYATIIDRVHIKSRNVNLQINVSFRKKDGTRIACRSPGMDSYTSIIDVAPIAVYNLKHSKFFQVDLFDEENDIYILSLREPLYFPFGGIIRLTTLSTESCRVGAVANYREVTS